MIHFFKDKKSKYTLVLLHGTGADEYDLVPLAESIAPSFNILSLRGRIQENGMNRFFKRLTIHTFDLESVKEETDYILNFLTNAKENYNIDNFVFLGYSNGATMITSLLLEQKEIFSGAVLLQPGLLKNPIVFPLRKETPVFISLSNNDPYLLPKSANVLIGALNASYNVTVSKHENGHSIPKTVLTDLYHFIQATYE